MKNKNNSESGTEQVKTASSWLHHTTALVIILDTCFSQSKSEIVKTRTWVCVCEWMNERVQKSVETPSILFGLCANWQHTNALFCCSFTFITYFCFVLSFLWGPRDSTSCGNRISKSSNFLPSLCHYLFEIIAQSTSFVSFFEHFSDHMFFRSETKTTRSFSTSQTCCELLHCLYDCNKINWILRVWSCLRCTLNFFLFFVFVFVFVTRDLLWWLTSISALVFAISCKLSLWMDSRISLWWNSELDPSYVFNFLEFRSVRFFFVWRESRLNDNESNPQEVRLQNEFVHKSDSVILVNVPVECARSIQQIAVLVGLVNVLLLSKFLQDHTNWLSHFHVLLGNVPIKLWVVV